MSSVSAISSKLMTKTIPFYTSTPLTAIRASPLLQSRNAVSLTTIGEVHHSLNCLSLSGQMLGHETPPEFYLAPNFPEFDHLKQENRADLPPLAPDLVPDFPRPPMPSLPDPDIPRPPMPSPPGPDIPRPPMPSPPNPDIPIPPMPSPPDPDVPPAPPDVFPPRTPDIIYT